MSYSNSNHTNFCQTNEMISKIANLTASYTGKGREGSLMFSAPVIMFILFALFLAGIFDISAVLDNNFRKLLSWALGNFIPVMSYLFVEAKRATTGSSSAQSGATADLSVRAGMILVWMLLVELLRKKVDKIRMREYSSTLKRAGRVVWLAGLVFFTIKSVGRKALFSILWVLCTVKLVQRIVFTEVDKRYYPDKSWLITSYMSQMLKDFGDEQGPQFNNGDDLMKRCRYIVMGEEKLEGEVTADGYKLNMNTDTADNSIVTVGKVWALAEENGLMSSVDEDQSIRRVCFSFALFKLFRRRFEYVLGFTKEDASDCLKHLMLMNNGRFDDETKAANELFQVMADEVKFLSEYYHSVVPVVLASPLFVLVNYFLLPVLVLAASIVAILICGNGDLSYGLSRMSADNYALQPGFGKLVICAPVIAAQSRPALFFTLDLSVTILLLIIFFFEEIWEFLTVLISNWFIVSMLGNYMAKSSCRRQSRLIISGAFRLILWLRSKMMSKYTTIRLEEYSFLPATQLSFKLTSVAATDEVKLSITKYLVRHCYHQYAGVVPPLSNGTAALMENSVPQLSWACDSSSVTEIILTWHIATCLLEVKLRLPSSKEEAAQRKVAVSLSRYCAYLVESHPELLPDRMAKAKLVVQDAKEELREMLGFLYYNSFPRARAVRLLSSMEAAIVRVNPTKIVWNGIKLGRMLMGDIGDEKLAWKVLADVWTELIVYAAPSSNVEGHADILAQGVELITVLWAFAMHTGLSRQHTPPPETVVPLSCV